jgi:cyclase
MLQTRLMPCLLMSDGALVKTVKFENLTYVGDPVNAVRIFNEKEVDELILLDIFATTKGLGIDFDTLSKLVSECFMPICYGGGVRNIEDMQRLFALGIEKVALGAAAFEVPGLIRQAASEFGSQAVVVTLDVKRTMLGGYSTRIRNGKTDAKMKPVDAARFVVAEGAGEILLHAIDREGTWSGFDLKLLAEVADAVNVPVIAVGGAGSLQDATAAVKQGGASAVAIGSLAVFQGKDLGVLVKFPSRRDQEAAFE